MTLTFDRLSDATDDKSNCRSVFNHFLVSGALARLKRATLLTVASLSIEEFAGLLLRRYRRVSLKKTCSTKEQVKL